MATKLNADLDIGAAMKTVNQAVTKKDDESEGKSRFVNLRMKEVEYKKIGHIATEAGITNTAFCKMAALYMADLVNAGVYSISRGGFVPLRKG
jgi:hypothetical protein